jgi:hypothetical protein
MYELLTAIKEAIEDHVLNMQSLTAPASEGDTRLTVGNAWRFQNGEQIALLSAEPTLQGNNSAEPGCDSKIDVLTVCDVIDHETIAVHPCLSSDYAATVTEDGTTYQALVQKLHEGQYVRYVVVGNPPSIPQYPSITIEHRGVVNSPLAIRMVEQKHRLRISAWADAATYDLSHRLVHRLSQAIETALFKAAFPIIYPWAETTIIEDVEQGDTLIKIDDINVLGNATGFYIVADGQKYPHAVDDELGNGVFRMTYGARRDYPKDETTVIRPLVHVYDATPEAITYGEGMDGDRLLLNARIDYSLKIARSRYREPFQ